MQTHALRVNKSNKDARETWNYKFHAKMTKHSFEDNAQLI